MYFILLLSGTRLSYDFLASFPSKSPWRFYYMKQRCFLVYLPAHDFCVWKSSFLLFDSQSLSFSVFLSLISSNGEKSYQRWIILFIRLTQTMIFYISIICSASHKVVQTCYGFYDSAMKNKYLVCVSEREQEK